MPRWQVHQGYRSYRDGTWYGYWPPDQVIDLSAEEAEWVNRDAPGTLTPDEPAKVDGPAEPDAPPPAKRARKPAADRQHRGGQNRAG